MRLLVPPKLAPACLKSHYSAMNLTKEIWFLVYTCREMHMIKWREPVVWLFQLLIFWVYRTSSNASSGIVGEMHLVFLCSWNHSKNLYTLSYGTVSGTPFRHFLKETSLILDSCTLHNILMPARPENVVFQNARAIVVGLYFQNPKYFDPSPIFVLLNVLSFYHTYSSAAESGFRGRI